MVTEVIKRIPSISLLLEEKFCVWITDREGNFVHVNKNFCSISKYTPEELIGQNFNLVHPSFCSKTFIPQVEKEIAKKNAWQRKLKNFAKDGSPFWVSATVMPILDEEGITTHFFSIDTDITKTQLTKRKYTTAIRDLKNIENALSQSSVVAITDPSGVISYVNEAFVTLSKYSSEELVGDTHRLINSGYHPKSFFKEMWHTLKSGKVWKGDIKNLAKDGNTYWVSTTIVPFLDKNKKPYQYIAIRFDITARKEAEKSLEIALKNDFRQTVKNLQNGIFKYTYDSQNNIDFTLLEGKILKKHKLSLEMVNKYLPFILKLKTDKGTIENQLLRGLKGEETHFEVNYSTDTFLIYLSPIFEDGGVAEVVGTAIDITDRKLAEKTIEQMAYFDSLTNLPNRRLMDEVVKETLKKAKQREEEFALLFLDLDRFKRINDSMGHMTGDQLLKAVGERLENCIREQDVIGRLNGDEFIILFPSSTEGEVIPIINSIVQEISEPFDLHNGEIFISASIGISMYPRDGEDYDTLLSNADSAMYVARKNNASYQFFTQELREAMLEQTLLEMELRQAINRNQLFLHYQPQFNMKTGQLKGMEALIRWNHPLLGIVSPGRFIPIAEETGLILPIGQWVLHTACQQAKNWQNEGYPPIRISINVSFRQFMQTSFVDDVKKVVQETQLDPKYVNIEITESMTSDVEACQVVLKELNKIGITVSIDDFGTGYSSLSYLSTFPINHLKIDQSFVREVSPQNQIIVKIIIDLAKSLGLNVIAEGVETEEQADFLRTLHCDEVQGFLYSKPLSLEDALPLLEKTKQNNSSLL